MLIGTREVGPGKPVFIIAELSANHQGSLDKAHRLVDVAADCGADAIKLQTYRPAELAALRGGGMAPEPWSDRTLLDLYEEAQTPWEWHAELFEHAKQRGMIGFSSTFSAEATAFLVGLGVPCLKVSAFEWQHRASLALPYGLPVIASVRPTDDPRFGWPCPGQVALLHCPPGYPAKCSLRGMTRLQNFAPVFGLSDHSTCIYNAVSAVTLGANIIEVHLMLGPTVLDVLALPPAPLDWRHSFPPARFAELVRVIRHTEKAL